MHDVEDISLPSGKIMKRMGRKYFTIIEINGFMNAKLKTTFIQDDLHKIRFLLRVNLNGRNMIQGINTFAYEI